MRYGRTRLSLASMVLISCGACAVVAADDDEAKAAAVQTARKALAEEGGAQQQYALISVEPHTWSDSSLGCPQRGRSYLQVVTPGYLVKLRNGAVREVRVAGRNAVICPLRVQGDPRTAAPRVRVTNLAEMESAAAADLAARLNTSAASIRVVERTAQRWPDQSLGCEGVAGGGEGASGFRLVLRAGERLYTYHTDLKRVFACPPIEPE